MKLLQVLTRLIIADHAACQSLCNTAFSDIADRTVSDQSSITGLASVTIDIFSLEAKAKLFRVKDSRLCPGNIIIIPGRQKCRTTGAD